MTDLRTITGKVTELVEKLRRVARSRLDNPDLALEWQAADTIERLIEALTDAREAIASLPEDGLGMATIAFGTPGVDVYPIRDELLSKIDAALQYGEGDN